MRALRALLTIAALAAGAAPAAAQALPDDGPHGQIELLSGEVIAGKLADRYFAKDAQANDFMEGVVLERPDGSKLYVPWRYFSKTQEYWANRRLWFPPPVHPVWRPDPNEPDPELTAMALWDLAKAALWAGPSTWRQAKGHFEHCVKFSETDSDPQTDPKRVQESYLSLLKEYGLHTSTKDGRWVPEDVFYAEQGWKKWRGTWVRPEEHERLVNEASAAGKRSLEGLVDKPEEYARVHLGMVRAFPGLFAPDKKGDWPKVRFFARYATAPEEKFTGIEKSKYKPPEFLRLRVVHDDCAHVYLATKNSKLTDRAKGLEPGDAVELFGRIVVNQGVVLLECDGIALR